jgi:hypothetical protein
MGQRRGTRTRDPDGSAGSDVISGITDGTTGESTQLGGDGGQQSQVGNADGAGDQRSANPGGQEGGQQSAGTQDGAQNGNQDGAQQQGGGGSPQTQQSTQSTNSYGHSTDEAAEFEKLKKTNVHAQQKITEQGQSLSDKDKTIETLTQQNSELGARFGRLEGVVAQVLARNGGSQSGTATASHGGGAEVDEFGNPVDPSQQDGTGESQVSQQDIDDVKSLVGRFYNEQSQHNKRFDDFESNQQRQEKSAYIERELGVSSESAQMMMDANADGDIVKLANIYMMTAFPAEARQQARDQRERQRNSTFHPATGGAPFAPAMADENAVRTRAEQIMGMQDGRPKQYAVEKFMSDFPGQGAAILAELSGFNL